jgi:hypothetical protein
MTTTPESRRVTNNQPVQPGSGEPGAIARAIVARAQWVQRALSPWVGRWLRASAGTETGRETRLGKHVQTALTGTHTNRLLDRVQRVVDRTTVWRGSVGSIEPAMVDRFASAIVDRFSVTGARYEPQPLVVSPAETADLILAGTPVQPGLGAKASLPGFETGGGEPAPRPTMAQLREILADRSSSPRSPPAPSQPSPPRIQRPAAEPPGPRPPARNLPVQARLFSRVEELPPREDTSPEGQPPEVRPAQAERASEPSQPAEPPSPPVVQRRRPAVVKETKPAQPETPAVSAAGAEPPRPRTRISRVDGSEVQRQSEEEPLPSKRTRISRINGSEVRRQSEEKSPPPSSTRMSRISGSEVQRLPEGEMPSQVPPRTEAPPSERTRIGRISGAEVQRLAEEEMSSQVPSPTEAVPSERTRMGRISGSEVQRLPEEEMPSQVPSPTEAPPSERTRMGRIDGSEVQRLPEGEMPSQVPSPTEAPPPERTQIGRISGLEVQRLHEEDMPSQVPSPTEAPPSERTRIGRISGAEVQRLHEGEMPSRVPSPTEPPPSERTRIGRISGAEVQRLHEGEMPSQVPAPTEPPPGPEVPAPPLAEVEPPMEPGQLRPARSADVPSVAEGVQRESEPEERAAGLGEEVLARAASRARLPLTEPLRPASGLGRTGPPAQMAIPPRAQVQARFEDERVQARFEDERVQARFEDEGVVMPVSKPVPARVEPARAGPARPPAWGGEFPLPPVSRPAPAALIQRQPVAPSVDLTVAAQGADVVQRAVETPPETGLTTEEEGSELDLDHLARQVYPLIKRMLAVERERRSAR